MKNPKVGEKVRAYFGSSSVKGEVTSVSKDLLAVTDEDDAVYWFDLRQCVRLVPKKRIEFWIPKEWKSENIAMLREQGNEWLKIAPLDNGSRSRFIHVREVKP